MRAAIVIALLVLFAVCASKRIWTPKQYPIFRRQVLPAAEEEADAEFLGKVLKKVGKVALQAGKAYVGSKYGIQLDDAEEEADSEFLGKALKKVGKVALNVGKMYLRTQGVPIDEAQEEADAEFLGKALKKVGKVALQVGKAYVGQKYGIQLDEEDEDVEADFINFKNLLKKVGGIALQAGKAYVGNKYGIQLDDEEEEESDFINWKKIGSIAKDIGKTYLSSKYGINLDEEEESDSEFLGKINWRKIGDIAKNVGKSYLSSKYGINLDEEVDAEEESDSADAYSQVSAAGIPISSSGRCHNRNVRSCTSLDGVRSNTLNGIITLKRASGCPITITGGTEIGHAGGQYSHSNGYKLDIALNSCIDNYIRGNFNDIGRRGDGAQQYRASSGNVYAREGNHWDITYY